MDFEPRCTSPYASWASMSRQNLSHHPSRCSSMTSISTIHNCLLATAEAKHLQSDPAPVWWKTLCLVKPPFKKPPIPPRFLFEKTFPTCLTLAHLQVGLIIMIIRAWLWPKFCLGHTSYICYYNHPGTPAGSPQCRHCLHGASSGMKNLMEAYLHLHRATYSCTKQHKDNGIHYTMSGCCRGLETS